MNTPNREDGKGAIGSPEAYILPTQQERSRATLDRILDAAESLLDERLYEDITIADIVDHASCSVGAFYSRVRTKEALLAYLRDRLYGRTLSRITEELAPSEWRTHTLRDRLRASCEVLVDAWRSRSGLLRAIVVNARRDPAFREHERSFEDTVAQHLVQLYTLHPGEVAHADPGRAARVAIRTLHASLRDQLIFADQELGDADARQLVDDLTTMLHGWLHSPSR